MLTPAKETAGVVAGGPGCRPSHGFACGGVDLAGPDGVPGCWRRSHLAEAVRDRGQPADCRGDRLRLDRRPRRQRRRDDAVRAWAFKLVGSGAERVASMQAYGRRVRGPSWLGVDAPGPPGDAADSGKARVGRRNPVGRGSSWAAQTGPFPGPTVSGTASSRGVRTYFLTTSGQCWLRADRDVKARNPRRSRVESRARRDVHGGWEGVDGRRPMLRRVG